MNFKQFASSAFHGARIAVVSVALLQFSVGSPIVSAQTPDNSGNTTSPIKHVIVIIGENRSFDHVFATYKPRKAGTTVWNLLSEGIVNADGTPGPNFSKAQQMAATDMAPDPFLLSPPKSQFPNNILPPPLAGGPTAPGFATAADATLAENGLEPAYEVLLTTGGTGLKGGTPDTRIINDSALPAGPFQLTPGMPYDAYSASPVHRFYQMWQQFDCNALQVSESNPNGCDAKLFPWVEVTVGAGTNGKPQSSPFTDESTGEGSTSMGFYNVQKGDVPYFKALADNYAMSDNFHQSVQGGTGANHIMLGHGDAIWFSDGNGNAMEPPENVEVFQGTIDQGTVNQVEDPDPAAGTNNWYTEDGYGAGSFGSGPSSGGGSYSECADPTQPGVAAVDSYLQSLPHPVDPHCEVGHYYLLNNYNPGYFGDGSNAYTDMNPNNTPFTVPPSAVPSIGDSLNAKNITWKYYGDQWNNYLTDKYQLNYFPDGAATDEYCNICNPFQYDTSIMGNPAQVAAHIQDTANLYSDIAAGTLPAVSFVKPSGLVDGHPASSKLDLFERFTKKIVDAVRTSSSWHDTAIFITFDEGGGYYDSGYVQPLDFFGDGTRIPLLVVSPYVREGVISHSYADHVSIVKFIDRNWSLAPISFRSRDNYPNPITSASNPYVPLNGPALSDLWDLFVFGGGK
jgi:phospholipase C